MQSDFVAEPIDLSGTTVGFVDYFNRILFESLKQSIQTTALSFLNCSALGFELGADFRHPILIEWKL